MTDLTGLTLAEARDLLAAKEITSRELTEAHLSAIEAANAALNAYLVVTRDKALEMAKASDARLAKGKGLPLDGLPLGIKDLFCTKGVRTTAGSAILDDFTPVYESTVTQNLWDAGAVMLGKLNMDEFAMGSSNETSHFRPCVNPWQAKGKNAALVPGGSSGGSASAVSARIALAATASDTGGSIRQPAAFTGTVGIKPTYGRCSRWGIVAFASSLDQAGPIARTVKDAAIMLRHMSGHDPKDSTSVDKPVPDFEAALAKKVRGLKIGIPREYRVEGMLAEVDALWSRASTGSRPRAPRSARSPCRIPNTRCPPITSSPPPRRPPTSPAMTASAMACASTAATSPPCMRRRARKASAPRSSGAC